MGFFDLNGKVCMYWRLLKDNEIPDIALNKNYVDSLYSNLDYKSTAELKVERIKRRKEIQRGSINIFRLDCNNSII